MINKSTDNKRKHTKYSPQFKDQALERALKEGVAQTAKELGLAESLLYSWRAKRQLGGDTLENQKVAHAELMRLKRENLRLQEENSFLKKVEQYFMKESTWGTPW